VFDSITTCSNQVNIVTDDMAFLYINAIRFATRDYSLP